MVESLDRVLQLAAELRMPAIENELVEAYYERHLLGEDQRDTETLMRNANSARKIASMWADLNRDARSEIPTDVDNPICRAARVMYYVAELLANNELKEHWYREAGIAYLQSGNIPATRTAWNLYRQKSGESLPGDIMVEAILGDIDRWPEDEAELLPQILVEPWLACDEQLLAQTQEELYERCSTPQLCHLFDKSLGYRVNQSLPLFGNLSLDGVFDLLDHTLPSWYRQSLVEGSRMMLMPSQVGAVRAWLGTDNGNALLCTPTSTGKTFVAEIATIVELSKHGGTCIFVTPYQAVARAIANVFEERLSNSNIAVIRAFGHESVSLEETENDSIVVATPEKLNGILLQDRSLLHKSVAICFDEAHHIAQTGRGAFYECLISQVLMEQRKTGRPRRVLAMSAVVENYPDLAAWLGVPDSNLATSRWRSNPLIASYWNNEDTLFVRADQSDTETRNFLVFEKFCPRMPPWPSPYVSPRGLPNALRKPLGQRCSWFARYWSEQMRGPILTICASRPQTREFAQMSEGNIEGNIDLPELARAAEFIRHRYPFLSLLASCLMKGVAYHNAALPSGVRRLLEQLFDKGLVPIVFSTTTLAEGADFPFRGVIIAASSHFNPESGNQMAMSSLLLRNIAGRGGRTKGHLIGDVFQMYSPYTMETEEGGDIESHEVFLTHLLDPSSSRVSSGLSRGVSDNQPNRTFSHVFTAFDRVLNRWPTEDTALEEYRQGFFDFQLRNGDGSELQSGYESKMTNNEPFGEPLATRASPLRLTPLGRTVLESGFDVDSASRIWTSIEGLGWFTDPPDAEGIIDLCAELGGRIPEVSELRDSNRRPLQNSNLFQVMRSLADGASLADAYLVAERRASGATQGRARTLVRGDAGDSDPVHARFEVFADDLKRKALIEIPILVRAMMLYVRFKTPSADVSAFELLLDTCAELRSVID